MLMIGALQCVAQAQTVHNHWVATNLQRNLY